MRDGMVLPDTRRGRKLGLTTDRFDKDSYLWIKGMVVMVSLIISLEKGNLRRLFKQLWSLGYAIHVPTPVGKMPAILAHYGFSKHMVDDERFGLVEVWKRGPR